MLRCCCPLASAAGSELLGMQFRSDSFCGRSRILGDSIGPRPVALHALDFASRSALLAGSDSRLLLACCLHLLHHQSSVPWVIDGPPSTPLLSGVPQQQPPPHLWRSRRLQPPTACIGFRWIHPPCRDPTCGSAPPSIPSQLEMHFVGGHPTEL